MSTMNVAGNEGVASRLTKHGGLRLGSLGISLVLILVSVSLVTIFYGIAVETTELPVPLLRLMFYGSSTVAALGAGALLLWSARRTEARISALLVAGRVLIRVPLLLAAINLVYISGGFAVGTILTAMQYGSLLLPREISRSEIEALHVGMDNWEVYNALRIPMRYPHPREFVSGIPRGAPLPLGGNDQAYEAAEGGWYWLKYSSPELKLTGVLYVPFEGGQPAVIVGEPKEPLQTTSAAGRPTSTPKDP